MLDVLDMGARVAERGMAWLHCPIPDFGPPGNAFESAWVDAGAQARGILSGGGKLVCHCRGGIGRAGTIASRLLIELGVLRDARGRAAPRPQGVARRGGDDGSRRATC